MSPINENIILQRIRRFIRIITVAFMIAWHNIYFQENRLWEEDVIEIPMEGEDKDEGLHTLIE